MIGIKILIAWSFFEWDNCKLWARDEYFESLNNFLTQHAMSCKFVHIFIKFGEKF